MQEKSKLSKTEAINSRHQKVEFKNRVGAIFENNFIKKNIYYFHNACALYKFNFTSRESKSKDNECWHEITNY
jgi:hypothetical protein